MLKLKNTIACPGCGGILRVSAKVVSDGAEYTYYLCPACEGVARQDPDGEDWTLRGMPTKAVAELVRSLQGLAAEEWTTRSTSRAPLR